MKLYYNFNFQFSLTVKVAANQYKKAKYPEGKHVVMQLYCQKKVHSKFPTTTKKKMSQVFELIIAKLQKTFKKHAHSAHSPQHKKQ